MVAPTKTISFLRPALVARLDSLRFLVVGPDAANEKSNPGLSHMRAFWGNRSVVKRNRGIGDVSGLSYCERTAHRLLAFPELVGVPRR
jgi:hypothetical protein